MADASPLMTTDAVIDVDVGIVFYLAFDLLLAEGARP
jgi:hypothetical protein